VQGLSELARSFEDGCVDLLGSRDWREE